MNTNKETNSCPQPLTTQQKQVEELNTRTSNNRFIAQFYHNIERNFHDTSILGNAQARLKANNLNTPTRSSPKSVTVRGLGVRKTYQKTELATTLRSSRKLDVGNPERIPSLVKKKSRP